MIIFTPEQLRVCMSESVAYEEAEVYASDIALSSAFLPEYETAAPDAELYTALISLWRIFRAPFRDFLRMLGMSQAQMSKRFCIPLRTVQDWAGERRSCAPYIRLMMAEIVGILNVCS